LRDCRNSATAACTFSLPPSTNANVQSSVALRGTVMLVDVRAMICDRFA
jgi:hypothetical protein